jgi:hypothetical protein
VPLSVGTDGRSVAASQWQRWNRSWNDYCNVLGNQAAVKPMNGSKILRKRGAQRPPTVSSGPDLVPGHHSGLGDVWLLSQQLAGSPT